MLNVLGLVDPKIKSTLKKPFSLCLSAGQAMILKGDNGSGKTSLLRIVSGILDPEIGTISLIGSRSYLPHQNGLYPQLKVCDYIHDIKDFFDFWQKTYQPWEDDYVGQKSQGQQRQIAIYLKKHADLWLMDEPTTYLDSTSKMVFYKRVQDHCCSGGSVLFSSHDEEFHSSNFIKVTI